MKFISTFFILLASVCSFLVSVGFLWDALMNRGSHTKAGRNIHAEVTPTPRIIEPRLSERRDDFNLNETSMRMPHSVVSSSLAVGDLNQDNVCRTRACNESATKILSSMDKSVNPCIDFYSFVCGGFIKNTHLPDQYKFVNHFTELVDLTDQQLRNAIEEPSPINEPGYIRAMKNYYKSCMDTAIGDKGFNFLKEKLKELGGWPVLEGSNWNETNFDLFEALHKFRKLGYQFDFFWRIEPVMNSIRSTYDLTLNEPLAIFTPIASRTGMKNGLVRAVYHRMLDIVEMLGVSRNSTELELNETFTFEMEFSTIMPSPKNRMDITTFYDSMTIAELSRNYSSIPWKKYINNILAPQVSVDDTDEIHVTTNAPQYIPKLIALIERTSKRVLANFIMWRVARLVVLDFIRYTEPHRRLSYSKECLTEIKKYIPFNILYIRKYFNQPVKNAAIEMANDLKNQLMKILQNMSWMDERTRTNALEKLSAISFHIGYPDEFSNERLLETAFEELKFDNDNYLQNLAIGRRYLWNVDFSKLKKSFNKNNWTLHADAAEVDVFYNDRRNSIDVPSAILQDVFFNSDLPKYMNYGAIGYIIGHELTHAFGVYGREYDKDGTLVNWWSPVPESEYKRKVQCFVNQYSNFKIDGTQIKIDGFLTRNEDIADNGGIVIAYSAYEAWSKKHEIEQSLPGLEYSPQQMFWISRAYAQCTKYRPGYLIRMIRKDLHSPRPFRVMGPLQNQPEFATAFNCPDDSRMNPKNKCTFW